MAQPVHLDEVEMRALDAIADRYFGAVEEGDVDAVASIYAPDARIWHNVNDYESSREESLDAFRTARPSIRELRYENVRRAYLPGALIQQHVIRGRDGEGTEIRCPAILKLDVSNGLITRIEEYYDGSQLPVRKENVARG